MLFKLKVVFYYFKFRFAKKLRNRKDIELLVNEFYNKVKTDVVIGYIFTEVAIVNWEKHLPRMYDFWENSIFYTGTYEGNPMELHKHLHRIMPLTTEHFAQWNKLFTTTVEVPVALQPLFPVMV